MLNISRKRDKRVAEWSKKLQEKAEENKRKTAEFQKKQREERKKLFEVRLYLIYFTEYKSDKSPKIINWSKGVERRPLFSSSYLLADPNITTANR